MRTKTIQSRTTEEEFILLSRAAELQGLRLNSFTRSAAIEKARQVLILNQEKENQ